MLDCLDSLNPCIWRGNWLCRHGCSVCGIFCVLQPFSWCYKLIVCKTSRFKITLRVKSKTLLCAPHWLAPYQYLLWDIPLYNRLLRWHLMTLFICSYPLLSSCSIPFSICHLSFSLTLISCHHNNLCQLVHLFMNSLINYLSISIRTSSWSSLHSILVDK